MRTLYPSNLIDFLNSGVPSQRVDLWTFSLQSGTVLRFVDHEYPLTRTQDGVTFSRTGPIIERTGVEQRRGLGASELTLTISATATDYVYGTVPWLSALAAGVFDYADVTLDVGVLEIGAPTVLKGWYNWFEGSVDTIPTVSMMSAEVRVTNYVSRLKLLMPRNLVSPGCLNTLYDKACSVSKSTWTKTGTVTGVNSDGSLVCSITGGTPATDAYNEGTFVFTSGNNANVTRKIKRNVSGTFYFFGGAPFTVSPGDTISVRPGCAKTRTACAVFGGRFRGFPYVPTPETIL